MIKNIFIFSLIIFQIGCFGQVNKSKSKKIGIPFFPIETAPRFMQDVSLSEAQNKKSFNQRILTLFKKHFNSQDSLFIKETIKTKAYITFAIDSLGKAEFSGFKPDKLFSKNSIENISELIDSLPRFIPGKQRNKPVKVKYTIPVFSKKYFQKDYKKASNN